MNAIASVTDRLSTIIRMRYTAILSICAMFLLILTAHILIDKRARVVFVQELQTNAQHSMNLIHERLSSRVAYDMHNVETFAYHAMMQRQISPDQSPTEQIETLAKNDLQKSDHIAALGIVGDITIHVERDGALGFTNDMIRDALSDEAAHAADVDGNGFSGRSSVKTLSPGTFLIFHSLESVKAGQTKPSILTAYAVVNLTTARPQSAHQLEVFDQVDSEGVVYALRDKQSGVFLFGNPVALNADHMSDIVRFGDVALEIVARPLDGWLHAPKIHENFRMVLLISALATLLPMLIAALLMTERNSNIDELKSRQAKLSDISQRFKLAMESSNIGLWEMSASDGRIFLDPRAASLHGYPNEDHYGTVAEWMGKIVEDNQPAVEAFLFNCTCSNQTHSQVYQIKDKSGALRYLRSAGANYLASDKQLRTIGIIWDVTADMIMATHLRDAKLNTDIKNEELELALQELSRREHQLEELSGRLNLALESYNCGTWQIDPYNVTAIWDERMYQLYDLERIDDRPVDLEMFLKCLHPQDREAANDTGSHAGIPTTHRVITRSGDTRYIRTVGQTYRDRNGKKRVVGIAFDVTGDVVLSEQLKHAKDEAEAKNAELELAKTRIEHNALHDPLTSLANRRKLDLELDRITKSSISNKQSFAILHLDLDRFKQINDTLGHAAGDAMLEHTSRILKENIRHGDLVARIGGDEFVILVEDFTHLDNIKAMAERIITQLNLPMIYENLPCRCGVSIGIALGDGQNVDSRAVLINADIALYRSKALGRNRYEFFTKNLQAEIINNKRTADEILTGLERNEFEAWYQPQICATTQKLVGAEALVRWRHPQRGILAPDQFLKVAEELNVVAQLDSTVLRAGLVEKRLWDLAGLDIAKLSVNVSARRLHDAKMLESLEELQIQPGEVAFELVESIFLDDIDKLAVGNIDAIKRLGIDIEIDDFGTGHTSIISLLKLKPKRLKIDRQLVTPITTSASERKLVRSIIEIAGSLGIETIAEGVETREHAKILSAMGCDILQGYLFSRPLPAEEFVRFARKEEWRIAS